MLRYRRDVLADVARDLEPAIRDEMAIPSYLHPNPVARWVVERRMRLVLRLMALRAEETLLDFGCGTGMLLLQLPPLVGRGYAVDLHLEPAQRMLEAHGRTGFHLLAADDWTRSVPDGSLDCVVALEVLEHVPAVRRLANLFHSKLKPTGRLVVCGPTESSLYRLGRAIVGFSGEYHHRDIFEIMRDVEQAGFSRETSRSIPLAGPAALFIATRYRPTS